MGHVDLWLADMDQHVDDLVQFESLLNDEERKKRSGIRIERVRNHSILSRGILRAVLATYFDCGAKEIDIAFEPLGKPVLGPKHSEGMCSQIHFNVSHSEGVLAIGVTNSGPIGVDIEKVRATDHIDSIASTLFSESQRYALNNLPVDKQLDWFFKNWVDREAVTKALGVGLLGDVQIEYPMRATAGTGEAEASRDELENRNCVSKLSGSLVEWSLLEFSPRTGYTGCLALRRGEHTLRTRWF